MRLLLMMCGSMMCAGCYDVDALSKFFDAGADLAEESPSDLAGADLTGLDLAGTRDSDGGSDGGSLAVWREVASGVSVSLRAIAADGDKLYIVGPSSTVVRIAADNRVGQDSAIDPGYNLRGAAGAGGSVWAVGDDGNILERQSGAWTLVSGGAGNTLYAAFALSSTDVVAVGTAPGFCLNMLCEDSGTLSTLFSVWARTTTDAFAVGEGGTILHHDTMFTPLTSGTTADLHGVFGSGTRIFAVGNGGTILKSDNDTDWTAETSGTTADLFAVWMFGEEAFAAGKSGVILHRAASGTWSLEHMGGPDLHAILGRSTIDVWAAGDDGALLHYAP